jgi:hypothetical protein
MNYKTKKLKVSQLLLNIENPRFDMVGTQREAITTMIENQKDKLIRLAEDILEVGMNPADLVIVVPHESLKNQYVVVEGNRRVTTLKLLDNPDLISEKHKSLLNRFKKLNEQYKKHPVDGVDCVVFDDEKDANRWIKLKHTGENDGVGTVTWDAQQKSRFEERIEGKLSFALQVIDFMQKQPLEESFKTNLKNVPSSSLQRLVTDPDFRRTVGIDVVDGKVVTKYDPTEVIKPLKKVMTDLLNPDFTVKEIYYKDDRLNYLETFKPTDLPNKSKELDGPWALTSPNPPVKPAKSSSAATAAKKSVPISTTRYTIIPKSEIMAISQPRVNKIYRELKDLDLREFINAAAITFRVFIELSIDSFIENMSVPGITKDDKLTKKVTTVATYMQDNGHLDKHKLKGIRTAATDQHNVMSIDAFNSYVHNKHFNPDPNNLKLTWDNISAFITKIWELI